MLELLRLLLQRLRLRLLLKQLLMRFLPLMLQQP